MTFEVDRLDKIHENIDRVLKEIKEGKIKNSKELNIRLSSFHLMRIRIPSEDYDGKTKESLKELEKEIKELKSKQEGYYFGIISFILGILGSTFFIDNLMSWFFVFGSVIVILLIANFVAKTKKEISSNELLIRGWYPYVLVEGSLEQREKLVKQDLMDA